MRFKIDGNEFDSLGVALRQKAQPGSEIVLGEGVILGKRMLEGTIMAVMSDRYGGRWELTQDGVKLECARFANGTWQLTLPTFEGRYPTAALDGVIANDRYLVKHQDNILDPHNIRKGAGSEWAGWWWSERYPDLPSAPNKEGPDV